jgi:hypothetical protein
MSYDRTARALHHLTLALAGVALTLAELPYIPWLPFGLIAYLLCILMAHTLRGRFILPEWVANLLAILIAVGAGLYIFFRSGADLWADDVPLPAALVPYLGPVLMALLCVRLFRPRSSDDFWLLQALALLQVGLGCILASGTLFAVALFAYLVTAAAALAAGERYRRGRRSAWVHGPPGTPSRWMPMAFRWGFGVALLAIPLFLLTPRSEQPDWDPLLRFGVRSPRTAARTGFGEEIDLSRTGRLVPDEAVAFHVETRDAWGNPLDRLGAETYFRGMVLDRYEKGVWRLDASWPSGTAGKLGKPGFLDLGDQAFEVRFRIPHRTGGLFLLDPVAPCGDRRNLPIRLIGETALLNRPLFFNIEGTPVPAPMTYLGLSLNEYRYSQYVRFDQPTNRAPTIPYRDTYLTRLLRTDLPELEAWTRELLVYGTQTPEDLRQELKTATGELPPQWWEAMARTLSNHLARSGQFRYSLQTERQETGMDPTLDFLLNVRSGPCDRYASALTLMLRSQGIPARIVKGYRGAERMREGQYLVRQSHAHAWVEALVASRDDPLGYEWLLLDPTPDSESTLTDLTRWLQRQQTTGQEFWRELVVNYNARSRAAVLETLSSPSTYWAMLPWFLGLLAALGLLWLVRRHARRKLPPTVAEVAPLLDRLKRLLTAPGRLNPAENATPGEFASQAQDWLELHGQAVVADIPREVVAAYYRVRFGQEALGAEEQHALGEKLDTLERALARVGT